VKVVGALYAAVRVISVVVAVAAVFMFLQAVSAGEGGEMFALLFGGFVWLVTALPLLVLGKVVSSFIGSRTAGDLIHEGDGSALD
jgi:hypothetical protein